MKTSMSVAIAAAIIFLSSNTFAQKNVLVSFAVKANLKGQVKSVKGSNYLNEYDKEGQLTAATIFNEDGGLQSISKFTYAKQHLLSENATYDSSKKLVRRTTYEYDTSDFEMKSVDFDSVGKVTYRQIRKYADNHHYTLDRFIGDETLPYKTDTVTTDADQNMTTVITTTVGLTKVSYSKKVHSYKPGNPVPFLTQQFDEAGTITLETQRDFDNNGNTIKLVEQGYGQTQTTMYEYTYDKKGNYIKWVSSGHNSGTGEMTIKYY